jgi:hypothetical protein
MEKKWKCHLPLWLFPSRYLKLRRRWEETLQGPTDNDLSSVCTAGGRGNTFISLPALEVVLGSDVAVKRFCVGRIMDR